VFRVHAGVVDYAILAVYFVVVLGIGFAARRQVHSGLDFFLSGRSLPAWITGLAFTLYGVILTVMGVFASDQAKTKAAGININLWAGLIILAGGAIFLAWARLRPLQAHDLQNTNTTTPKPSDRHLLCPILPLTGDGGARAGRGLAFARVTDAHRRARKARWPLGRKRPRLRHAA
jgi:hypothetical protein